MSFIKQEDINNGCRTSPSDALAVLVLSINFEKKGEDSENSNYCVFHFGFAVSYAGDQVSELSNDSCRINFWWGRGGSGGFGCVRDG